MKNEKMSKVNFVSYTVQIKREFEMKREQKIIGVISMIFLLKEYFL